MQSDRHTHSSQYGDTGRAKKEKKIGTPVNAAGQGNVSVCHRFASTAIDHNTKVM